MELTVKIGKNKTEIAVLSDATKINIFEVSDATFKLAKGAIFMVLKDNAIQFIADDASLIGDLEFDKVITVDFPEWQLESQYLVQVLTDTAQDGGLKLAKVVEEKNVPSNMRKAAKAHEADLVTLLETFGYRLQKKKSKPAKAQHRWSKAVSEIEFKIDTRDSQATVFWQKRNEMLIKKGATMMKETPLNKDGSVGFSARFALTLRDENADKFKNFKTTEDIVLKSVNEVGHFLYFAGTNSWLEMFDKDGKTIDEWTVVK